LVRDSWPGETQLSWAVSAVTLHTKHQAPVGIWARDTDKTMLWAA
jgi:hypothetical protein